MKIVPLSEKYLDQAIALCNENFPGDVLGENPPELGFRESLFKEDYKWAWEKYRIVRVEYYVLISEEDIVIGVTGIYENTSDPRVSWLGWFCVEKQQREKGFGKSLLEFTIEKAREYKYKELRLYTDPDESPEALSLYKKYDFVFLKKDIDAGTKQEIIVLSKIL